MSLLDYLPIIGDIAGAAGGVASALISDESMRYASDKQLEGVNATNAMNWQIANTNNEAAKQLWREQSEYNSPANQMKRYIEAGLNPNLMASSGQVNSGNAASPPALQQATMKPYTGYVQTAIARSNMLQNAVSSVTSMLGNIADWQKKQQDIKTSQAQENWYRSQAENLDKLRPWNVLRASSDANWFSWRNQTLRTLDNQDPTGNSNWWNQALKLATYNTDAAYERAQNLKFMNLVNDAYGMQTALAKLNYTKSATVRNQIASFIQQYLAPAQKQSLLSLAALNDERTMGQTLANGLSAYNLQDASNGGDFGLTIGGSKFTIGSLMRAVKGIVDNVVGMAQGKAVSYYR